MANTYTLISSQTLSASASSVSFNSIPATYTDLLLRCSTRSDYATVPLLGALRFNNDTGNNYSNRQIYWDNGSNALSSSNTANNFVYSIASPSSGVTANTFSNNDIYIPNYASSNYKSFSNDGVAENNATTPIYMVMLAGLWSNTSAITSITAFPGGGANFISGSTFYLYGIKNS